MSNYTIREQNMLNSFESESAQELYLNWAQKDEQKAYDMAYEWDGIYRFLNLVTQEMDYGDTSEAMKFIRDRMPSIYLENRKN